jgi:type II secretory pathway pseudopilin PulG
MNARRRRRGFTMVELCATCALLAVAIPLTVAALGAAAKQRRGIEMRQQAIEAADNLLERLTAESWDRLSDDRLNEIKDALGDEPLPPGGELQFQLVDQAGPPAAKRIDVEVSWQPGAARIRQRVRLSGWVFREAAP